MYKFLRNKLNKRVKYKILKQNEIRSVVMVISNLKIVILKGTLNILKFVRQTWSFRFNVMHKFSDK